MGIGIAALLIGLTLWAGTFLFQVLKRGRPDAFYQHRILLALQSRRIWNSGYRMPHGPLSIGRRRRCR